MGREGAGGKRQVGIQQEQRQDRGEEGGRGCVMGLRREVQGCAPLAKSVSTGSVSF